MKHLIIISIFLTGFAAEAKHKKKEVVQTPAVEKSSPVPKPEVDKKKEPVKK